MKKLFRMISVLLTVSMLLGSMVPVWADEENAGTAQQNEVSQTVKFCVQDSDGSLLAGAGLTVKAADGSTAGSVQSAVDTAAAVSLLPGDYTLCEETVPEGYVKAEDIAFSIASDGSVTVSGTSGEQEAADRQIVMINEKNGSDDSTAADSEKTDSTASDSGESKESTVMDSSGSTAAGSTAAESAAAGNAAAESVTADSTAAESTATENKAADSANAAAKSAANAAAALKSTLLGAASPQDVSSYFHATIVTKDGGSEYVSGSTVTFLVKYKLDYGVINEGDYIYLTVPAALAVERLSVDPTHFSSADLDHTDADGNQVYKLVFSVAAHEGISGSMTLRVTANNAGTSNITPTMQVGNDTASITVIPGGTPGTGTENRAIEKDALGSDGTGMSTGWNSKEGGYSIYDPDKGAEPQYRVYVNLKHAYMTNVTVTDYLPAGLTFDDSITYCWTEQGQSDVDLTADELGQIHFTQNGNKLIWNLSNLLTNQKQLLIQYKAKVPDGIAATYHNVAVIDYTEGGTDKTESASRNIYPESNASASMGVKSVDKTEISSDPADQFVEYTFTFRTHSNSSYEMIPFEIGDINLNDELNASVSFSRVSFVDPAFSVTYDKSTNTVHITNSERIADSGAEHQVSFVVDFSKVPAGTTVTNTVGGNVVKTKKYGGGLNLAATKTLDGDEPGNHVYSFQLLDTNGKVLQTKKNDSKGVVTFDQISYAKNDIGKTYTYHVKEVQGSDASVTYDGSDYTVTVTPTEPKNDGNITATPVITKNNNETVESIVFNNTTPKISIPVTKAWVGQPGKSVTVHLFADGVEKESATLDAAGGWTHTFSELPKYDSVTGKEIAYTLTEDDVSGYTEAVTGDAANGFTVTNTIAGQTSVGVTKKWVGPAASSVTVDLYADGVKTGKSQTLNADNGWQYTFAGLDKYKDGKEIAYTVQEEKLDGYSTAVTGDATKGYTITNTNTATISIPVTKAWVGKAGKSVTVHLFVDGVEKESATLDAAGGWTHTFSELPKYDSATGKEIAYTLTEDAVSGYTSVITGTADTGFKVTNTIIPTPVVPTPEKISVGVTKKWVGPAASSVTVDLYADGLKTDKSQILNSGNGWQYTFTNLDKEKNGKEIVYTVQEEKINGYQAVITGSAAAGFTVTNTDTEAISIPVTKTWIGKTGTYATVYLLADGVKKETATMTAASGWACIFKNLPKYDQTTGKEIIYTITEEALKGYASTISGNANDGFVVVNKSTSVSPLGTVTVTKKWNDESNSDGLRPSSVTLQLQETKDGKTFDVDGMRAVLTINDRKDANTWTYTFTGLPLTDKNGKDVIYSVREINTDSNYSAAADGLTVTNTHVPTHTVTPTSSYTAYKSSDCDGKTVKSGDKINYRITLTNTGNTTLTGMWVRDYIPENTLYISADSGGERGAIDGKQQVSWFISSMSPGEVVVLTMTVEVNDCIAEGCTIRNVAYTEVTNTPDKPDINKPENPNTPTNEVVLIVRNSQVKGYTTPVKTGDTSNIAWYLLLMIIAMVPGVVVIRKRRLSK